RSSIPSASRRTRAARRTSHGHGRSQESKADLRQGIPLPRAGIPGDRHAGAAPSRLEGGGAGGPGGVGVREVLLLRVLRDRALRRSRLQVRRAGLVRDVSAEETVLAVLLLHL